MRSLILGTRGSALARAQTEIVAAGVHRHFPDLEVEMRVISTAGDRNADVPVSRLGDKGVWVRSIERALLSGEIDIAVHSLKDVPSDSQVPDLVIAAFAEREDPRDVLVTRGGEPLERLPTGARIGTSSLRRRVQLLAARADVEIAEIRGNVDTRLRKLDEGQYDGIVLAAAGLKRLGLEGRVSDYLPIDLCTPDAGQGILAVQTRLHDPAESIAGALDDTASRLAAIAERAVVRGLGADCRSPVGVLATIADGHILVRGMAARDDGMALHRDTAEGPAQDAESLGANLGARLLHALGA